MAIVCRIYIVEPNRESYKEVKRDLSPTIAYKISVQDTQAIELNLSPESLCETAFPLRPLSGIPSTISRRRGNELVGIVDVNP